MTELSLNQDAAEKHLASRQPMMAPKMEGLQPSTSGGKSAFARPAALV